MTDRTPMTMILSEWAGTLTYEDLPDEVVHQAKRVILDYLAATLVGSTSEPARSPIIDAQFSIPWSVAAALGRGELDLGALTDEALHDEATEALATRVDVVQDLEADGGGMTPVWVELELDGGATHRIDITALPGSPEAPLDWDAIATKVRGCLRVVGSPEGIAGQLAEEVQQLPSGGRFTGFPATSVAVAETAIDPRHDEEQSQWTSA